MSFLFEKVYFPLIEGIIKASGVKQNSRNSFRKEKFTDQDFDTVRNKKLSNSKSRSEKLTLQGFEKLSSQSNPQTGNEDFKNSKVQKSQNQLKNQEHKFQTQRKDIQKNWQEKTVFIISKHSQKNESQEVFHNDLKQSLIANASSYCKSQRLETIFQSARKQRTQKSRSNTFQTKTNKLYKSNNKKLTKEIDVDEISRKNLRKSFCLKIVDNDQQWEGVCSKSLKEKKMN